MEKSTVTSKGQTTVPREVRRCLQVAAGTALLWEIEGTVAHVTVAAAGFLRRRGSVSVGRGSVVDDLRGVRGARGRGRS